MPPYRSRPELLPEAPAPEEGLVEEMVRQFADTHAFVRERVQNATDAGASRIFVPRARLKAVGCDRALFPDDALVALHEASQGALREIDRLGLAALREAARRKKKLVDRDVVTRVAEAIARFD